MMNSVLDLSNVVEAEKSRLIELVRSQSALWGPGQLKAKGATDPAWQYIAQVLSTPDRVFDGKLYSLSIEFLRFSCFSEENLEKFERQIQAYGKSWHSGKL